LKSERHGLKKKKGLTGGSRTPRFTGLRRRGRIWTRSLTKGDKRKGGTYSVKTNFSFRKDPSLNWALKAKRTRRGSGYKEKETERVFVGRANPDLRELVKGTSGTLDCVGGSGEQAQKQGSNQRPTSGGGETTSVAFNVRGKKARRWRVER